MTPTTPVAISSPPTTTVMTSPTATTAPAVTTTLNTTGQPSVGSQPEAKKEEPEPVRANVRRTLHELLDQRAKQDTEINMTSTEIDTLSVEIEEELYNYFKDTGAKYKSKYRSLVFNIKDPKNLTLYKKILGKSISPGQLVRLTPEELASQELAQWREKEAKHQLEIIKKNELDLIHQAKTVVLKSRKGEEVIETKNHKANISELESALNRTAEDYEVQEKNSTCVKGEMKVDSELLKLEEKLKTREKEERRKNDSRKKSDRKADRKHDRGRSRSRKNSGRSRRSHSHRSHSKRSPSEKHSSRHHKKVVKEEEEEREEPNIKTEVKTEDVVDNPAEVKVEDCAVEEDSSSNSSDREPSSTVTINTPPYIDAEEEEQQPTPVWKGTLNMTEVTKLFTKAFEVSGSCEDLGEELSEHLECVGRIQPESVWDYVSRMKKAGTKNIIVVRFASESHQEKMNYLALYSYLNSRNRMAVIGNVSKTIKDFYVLPLASHSPIPQVLLPLDGPGFEDYRPHLLLGIIIRSRK
ncbi:hypothetical protein AAG570_006037 [Ranatra chinensis]|uniref:TFIIS central domain-containing protein n=1 Tax=Ranatra chinensis TaxID=642074 RepID=A0ABD0XWV6_9HEMI